jgi:hypothetical protein
LIVDKSNLWPLFLMVLALARCEQSAGAEIDFVTLASLPPALRESFDKSPQAKRYAFTAHINPFYLHGDFDGDGVQDTAVLIKERATGKIGTAIFHGKTNRLVIVGAGRDLGNGSDDFSWLNAWHVFRHGPVRQGADGKPPPSLRGDALMVIKTESASALIYWDGKRYGWYQQGD